MGESVIIGVIESLVFALHVVICKTNCYSYRTKTVEEREKLIVNIDYR